MISCANCGRMLIEDAAYCNSCNTGQNEFDEFEKKPVYKSTFFKGLCIVTILAAVMGILNLPSGVNGTVGSVIYFNMAAALIMAFVAILKLTGAVILLIKKRAGLYIYTFAVILGLPGIVFYMMADGMFGGNIIVDYVLTILSVVLLIMYWLPANRKLLS